MTALEDNMARVAELARHHRWSLTQEQFDEIESLAVHAEPAVALETLCSLLYEHDRPVTGDEADDLDAVARQLGIAPSEISRWRTP